MADEEAIVTALRPLVLAAIKVEMAHQLLFLNTVKDAADLAGEQVQDKRLDLLTDAPDTTGSAILLDLLISLALGPASSVAVRAFATTGTRAILALRGAVVKKNGIYGLTKFTEATIEQAEQAIRKTRPLSLVEDAVTFEYWKKVAEEVGGVPLDLAKRRARIAAEKAVNQGDRRPPVGDTASVAVRRAAAAFVRLQGATVQRTFGGYEDQARSDTITFDEMHALNNLLLELQKKRAAEPAQSNEDTERELSLFFEACIWILHFSTRGGTAAQAYKEVPALSNFGPYGIMTGSNKSFLLQPERPIMQYWMRRFPYHPGGDGRTSFLMYQLRPAILTSADQERAARALLQWFALLEAGATKQQAKLRDLGLEVLGPVTPK